MVVLAALFLVVTTSALSAQVDDLPERDPSWSDPVRVYTEPEAGDLPARRALMAADGYGQLHVVVDSQDSIGRWLTFYTRWDGVSWSEAIDIAVLPFRVADLIWDGQDEILLFLEGGVWLSSHVAAEPSGRSWTVHELDPYGPRNSVAAIAEIVDGRPMVCYAVAGAQVECSHRDVMGYWIEPSVVSQAPPDTLTNWPRLARGPGGRLHVVWTELDAPQGWPPVGVFHAYSDDEGLRWTEPRALADGRYDQINVVADDDEVHVAWLGAAGTADDPGALGRYHRYSLDGGDSWSPQVTITTLGATEGWPEMALDADGVLHLVNSISSRPSYLRYEGIGWSQPSYIALEPGVDVAGEPPSNREYPVMVASQGRLHALFRDVGGWWYTSRAVGDAGDAILPLPGAPDLAAAMDRPTRTEIEPTEPVPDQPAPIGTEPIDVADFGSQGSPYLAVMLGLLPVLAIIGWVLARRPRAEGRAQKQRSEKLP